MTQRRNPRLSTSFCRRAAGLGLGTVLVLLLTGCAATVSPGYVGEPYYEPYYAPYDGGLYYDYPYYPYYGGGYIHRYYGHPRYEVHEYHRRGFDHQRGIDSPHPMVRGGESHVGRSSSFSRGQGHGGSDDHHR